MTASLPVTVHPHPILAEPRLQHLPVAAGARPPSLRAIVAAVLPPPRRRYARVAIAGTVIDPALWERVRPKPGHTVLVQVIPEGGGGDDGKVLSTVITVATIAASFALAGATTGFLGATAFTVFGAEVTYGTLAAAAVTVAGTLAARAVAPTPSLGRLPSSRAGEADDRSFVVTGTRNRANPWGPVPEVLGRHKVFPTPVAPGFTEVIAKNRTRWRGLFAIGLGEYDHGGLRIGDTPARHFDGVRWRVAGPGGALKIYSDDVEEVSLQVELRDNTPVSDSNGWHRRRTPAGVDEISIDIGFPQGLFNVIQRGHKRGRRSGLAVQFKVQYRDVAGGNWTDAPMDDLDGGAKSNWSSDGVIGTWLSQNSAAFIAASWAVPRGQYDVRVKRSNTELPDREEFKPGDGVSEAQIWNAVVSRSLWTALRGVRHTRPVAGALADKATLLEVRVDGTEQLNGVVDQFNIVARRKARVVDLGQALQFDKASGDRVDLPAAGLGGLTTGDFTVEWRMRATSRAGVPGAICLQDTIHWGNRALVVYLAENRSAGGNARIWWQGQDAIESDAVALADGDVHWGALVMRAGTLELYLDDPTAPVATAELPDSFTADRATLGAVADSNGDWTRFYHGELDEVRFWDHARSVWQLEDFKAVRPAGEAGLVAYYGFDAGDATDDSGNGNHGTLVGPATAPGMLEAMSAAPQVTRNPAWLAVDRLTGPGRRVPEPDSRIDLPRFKAFADWCDAGGYTFDGVLDRRRRVIDNLRDILAVGHGALVMRGDLYSVAWDGPQATVAQHVTPSNSSDFKSEVAFHEPPHAIRGRFVNKAADWADDEVTVYFDGHDASTATRVEVMELPGITEEAQAVKFVRRAEAEVRLRPEVYSVRMGLESIAYRLMQLVRLQHDVPMFGLASAEVRSVTRNASDEPVAVGLDRVVAMEAGKSYAVRIRQPEGGSLLRDVVTAAGETSTLNFAEPVPAGEAIAPGNIVQFGEAGQESAPAIVRRVKYERDGLARVFLVDQAPALQDAESGAIPEREIRVVRPTRADRPAAPPAPSVEAVQSDERVLRQAGDRFVPRIVVTVARLAQRYPHPVRLQARWRLADSGNAWTPAAIADEGRQAAADGVEAGETYDVELRWVAEGDIPGLPSPWARVTETVVGGRAPPPDVPTLFLERDRLRWTYPHAPVDLAGFRVRHRSGNDRRWTGAIPAHDGLVGETGFDISGMARGTRTFLVKAVDRGGNESGTPAALVWNLGEPVAANVVETVDYGAAGFPGIVEGGELEAGSLVALGQGAKLYGGDADGRVYSGDGTADFYAEQFDAMTYTAAFVPDTQWLPEGELLLDTGITGPHRLEYRHPPAVRLYEGVAGTRVYTGEAAARVYSGPGDWVAWPGRLQALRRQRYELRVVSEAGPTRGEIDAFRAVVDMPDIVERLEDVAVAAGGTRLPITESYREIKRVAGITLQDDGGDARTVKVVDKATTGPLVRLFDGAGGDAAGVIDVEAVQGY